MPDFYVRVYDNFHYMDKEESYLLGPFATEHEAIDKAKAIVRDSLDECSGGIKTGKDLMDAYRSFGEDPAIVGETTMKFSAWDYAQIVADEADPHPF